MDLNTQRLLGLASCGLAIATPLLGHAVAQSGSSVLATIGIYAVTFAPVIVPGLLAIGIMLIASEVLSRWRGRRRNG